ncbi:hypothetical protein E6W39_27910 [Kitasatospora acidiphila]|uniref:Uncharacterized protein n=1 Tax=Kitasatospora acidiphila TaxID=2567942 RepID=A0A540WAE5_9ACTN|nr:hypothetical protein [Kitasatospora acidiphila]TQF05364.1 hypothetical protein E6W39_27910 [Kitasatospora acidiphila]
MSTYLALTFGTLLSSQGTDASFEFASAFSPGASFFRVSSLSDVLRAVSGFGFHSDSLSPFGAPELYQSFPARFPHSN